MTRKRIAKARRSGFVDPAVPSGRRALARARRAAGRRSSLAWVAGVAASSLVLGGVVTLTLDLAPASAGTMNPPAVDVAAGELIAGEDVDVAITFTGDEHGQAEFNLSFGVVLPEGIAITDTGTLGSPTVYPSATATDRIVPGIYQQDAATDCDDLGLEPASPMPLAPNDHACQVPLGKQYLVFQNVSDLPAEADTTHTLSLRPDADVFPVGAPDLDLRVSAYTSSDETLVPAFPGSTGLAPDTDSTSKPGIGDEHVPVLAMRIEKSVENAPEGELLRGVHENATTYTLKVFHTGEGDIAGGKVIDFLPAGLEYLGLGEVDHTTNANGTRGVQPEYQDAPSLVQTIAPTLEPTDWQRGVTETVETITATAQDVTDYGLEFGKVYTKVTWDLGSLVAPTDPRDVETGKAQAFPGTAGVPGALLIRYRAGIPLFENTMDFDGDGDGGQPGTDGAQTANLDNNRGASTRHGHPTGDDSDAPATSYTNVAVASGTYGGSATSSTSSLTVGAVDIRVVKEASDSDFTQTDHVEFTLHLATSEYMSTAAIGAAGPVPAHRRDGRRPLPRLRA